MDTIALSPGTRIVGSPEVMTTVLDDEMVLLDLRTGTYFGMNALGRRVWELLDGRSTLASVEKILRGEYAVSPETLREDLHGFLRSLAGRGLIHEDDNRASCPPS